MQKAADAVQFVRELRRNRVDFAGRGAATCDEGRCGSEYGVDAGGRIWVDLYGKLVLDLKKEGDGGVGETEGQEETAGERGRDADAERARSEKPDGKRIREKSERERET
eukprot:1499496-Rhodomonas_salina.1